MIFDVDCESRAGSSPKKYGSENQDAFAFDKTNNICCLCIADGAGSRKHSAVGAKWLVNDLCRYMMHNADTLFQAEEQPLTNMIMERIKHSLDKTVRLQNVEFNELSSTLICLLTDGVQYLIVHLGDGCVCAIRCGAFNVLSFPQNGSSRQSTALTTMPLAKSYIRTYKGKCSDIVIFWLLTDGAMYKVLGDKYELNGEKLSMPMIRRRLSDGHSDDATYGYIKCGSI